MNDYLTVKMIDFFVGLALSGIVAVIWLVVYAVRVAIRKIKGISDKANEA